jgi:DNA-binding LacI/PurR family transcriptional regulator
MPAHEMGRRAAQFLFERLENPEHDPMQEVMPTNLVIRASTVAAGT